MEVGKWDLGPRNSQYVAPESNRKDTGLPSTDVVAQGSSDVMRVDGHGVPGPPQSSTARPSRSELGKDLVGGPRPLGS